MHSLGKKPQAPPRGLQLSLETEDKFSGARQLELSRQGCPRRPSAAPPLVDGFSSAKRVPDAFFHPSGEVTLEMLARKFSEYGKCSPDQLRKLEEAHNFLISLRSSSPNPETGAPYVREDGSDYLQHALRVAYRIAVVGSGRPEDLQQVLAAMLHDVAEDFGVRLEELRDRFGAPVSDMVFWLTKPKWDGKNWVYPDSECYYSMEDRYDHSMYDRRGYSYYRRLYYDSGNTSAWVIKAADNLDNLHTLKNVRPEKRQRNARLIVNNTMAVLSRMLAIEDTERLVFYLEDELGFQVPRDTIAKGADSFVARYPPREVLVRQGLEGVHAPRYGQINVYGADPKHLLMLGWLEIGLPDDGTDYFPMLRSLFREYTVIRVESYLPPGLAASEKIFRISGCRRDDQFRPFSTSFDAENLRVHLIKDGKPLFGVDLVAIRNIHFDDPQLKALCAHLAEQCDDLISRLEHFRKNLMHRQSPG